jgi:hypothetical protein
MEWTADIRRSITGEHKEEMENKKLQEMTRELHSKNTDSDVVKETAKDPSEKRKKKRRYRNGSERKTSSSTYNIHSWRKKTVN